MLSTCKKVFAIGVATATVMPDSHGVMGLTNRDVIEESQEKFHGKTGKKYFRQAGSRGARWWEAQRAAEKLAKEGLRAAEKLAKEGREGLKNGNKKRSGASDNSWIEKRSGASDNSWIEERDRELKQAALDSRETQKNAAQRRARDAELEAERRAEKEEVLKATIRQFKQVELSDADWAHLSSSKLMFPVSKAQFAIIEKKLKLKKNLEPKEKQQLEEVLAYQAALVARNHVRHDGSKLGQSNWEEGAHQRLVERALAFFTSQGAEDEIAVVTKGGQEAEKLLNAFRQQEITANEVLKSERIAREGELRTQYGNVVAELLKSDLYKSAVARQESEE